VNVELVATLLLLMADDAKEVSEAARASLFICTGVWYRGEGRQCLTHEGKDIEDAEVEMRSLRNADINTPTVAMSNVDVDSISEEDMARAYLVRHVDKMCRALTTGVSGWTTGARFCYLRGIEQCCLLIRDDVALVLPRLVTHLGSCLLEDDAATRTAAEQTCRAIGRELISYSTTLEVVVPYISGDLAGHDTAQSRAIGLRLSTHVIAGHLDRFNKTNDDNAEFERLITIVGRGLASPSLHEFREVVLRESALLACRMLCGMLKQDVLRSGAQVDLEASLVTALVFLMGRVAGDGDTLVAEVWLHM
jgi:hypothetical protein